jgi:hypothetical protein
VIALVAQVGDYYLDRWVMFVAEISLAVTSGVPYDDDAYQNLMFKRDLAWNMNNNAYAMCRVVCCVCQLARVARCGQIKQRATRWRSRTC